MSIFTPRLELVAASEDVLRAAQEGDSALAGALNARLPASWPPEFYGPQSLEFTLARLAAGPEQAGWWLHYFVVQHGRAVIGYGGYKGPPTDDGTVEVGYAIVGDYQRQGYATEATGGFVARAFSLPRVTRVVAETVPERAPSIRVLEKLGFRLVGEGSEEGVIRYEVSRPEFIMQP